MTLPSQMRQEIAEIPAAVARLLAQGGPAIETAAKALRDADPAVIISVARGSSDHAATYFKYITELIAGVPVASVGPSVASVYRSKLKLGRSACLAISQSGMSPDIVQMTDMARDQGALTMAVTNNADSDLAQVSDHTLALYAGPEQSVAATKTFVTSLVTVLWLVAEWTQETALLRALHGLPDRLLAYPVSRFRAPQRVCRANLKSELHEVSESIPFFWPVSFMTGSSHRPHPLRCRRSRPAADCRSRRSRRPI